MPERYRREVSMPRYELTGTADTEGICQRCRAPIHVGEATFGTTEDPFFTAGICRTCARPSGSDWPENCHR